MFRDHSVPSTLRIALLAALIPVLMTGCIFSPDQTEEPPVVEAPIKIDSPEALIQALAQSYRDRNLTTFANLLADDPDNRAEYLFILDPAANANDPQWGYTEEVRVHQRMFEPQNTPPGQTPVEADLWLTSVSITLTQSGNFTERTDLYESTQNPTGLDPAKWKVVDAIYATDVLFDLQGNIDFQVTGRANFVVIEDLGKDGDTIGRFLILQWNDLAGKPSLGLPS